ncbi:MAG: FCD domain-containing protein [Chitinophagaceae bacterium]|nr:FCD domain-containing protein [Rubrivivax sp.]
MRALDPSATLIAAAYERLRHDIVSARWRPGVKLGIEALKTHYQLGPSPLREALNRLAAEGWVEHLEQRGFVVAAASAELFSELLQTRIWAEGTALRESIQRRDAGWEDHLVLALHHLSRVPRSLSSEHFEENPQWEPRHRAFHMALLSRCGSRYLLNFCGQLYDQAYRYRQIAVSAAYGQRRETDEHRAVAEAAIAGRVDDAHRLLVAHYELTARFIRAPASDPPALTPPQAKGSLSP